MWVTINGLYQSICSSYLAERQTSNTQTCSIINSKWIIIPKTIKKYLHNGTDSSINGPLNPHRHFLFMAIESLSTFNLQASRLENAVRSGNIDDVRICIKEGDDINFSEVSGTRHCQSLEVDRSILLL